MNSVELFEALKLGFSEAKLQYRAYHGNHKFDFPRATEDEVSKVAIAVFQAAVVIRQKRSRATCWPNLAQGRFTYCQPRLTSENREA